MFWKFGFQHASAIDGLLDRDDVSLELILDEDDLLQECKSQNTRLIDYFQRVDVLSRLLGYVSGQIEGEERGRFKYPYVAAEVLCSEIWSIVETCVNESDRLLLPFWNSILDTEPQEMGSKISLATHFVKITAIFMQKKPDEMFHFIRSIPNIVERLLAHIESPPFVDLIFRILQLDEQPGNMGVVQWFSTEKLIPHLIALLAPTQSPDVHLVAAEVLKGVIALSSPSPSNFPVNPSTMSMMGGEASAALPTSNRLARELAHKDNVTILVDYMLQNLDMPPPEPAATATTDDDTEGDPSSPHARAISSLVNIIPVFIELIRKNNSDFFEPYLFHALRNRLIQIRQQQQFTHRNMSEEEHRQELEHAMQDIVEHMGLVHLGGVLNVLSSRLEDLQRLLKKPRSSIVTMSTTTGPVVPLTFERFRICELYAEILHCSNMALLNRPQGTGPTYDEQGRLVGGLAGLEELAKLVSTSNDSEGSHTSDEDPGSTAPEHAALPTSPKADNASIGSGDGISADDVDVEDVLEEVHFDDDDPNTDPISKVNGASMSDVEPQPSSPSTSTASMKPSNLSIEESSLSTADTSLPSPRSDKTVIKHTKGKRATTDSFDPGTSGDRLKQQFLDLDVIPSLLDLFFSFPLNNFLHNVVYDLLHQILTGRVDKSLNRDLIVSLFQRAQILERIIDGQRKNDEACSKAKGYRAGYMGHLTLISEDIVSAFDHCPPELIEILSQYAPRPEWDQYVSGKYKETRDKDTSQLGGGKPVLGLGLAAFPNMSGGRRIDEGEESPTVASSSDTPDSSRARVVEVEQDDSATNDQFASYLANQINPQEQFSSSSSDNSSDDDDSAWLDAANRNFQFDEAGDFDIAAPSTPDFSRRRNSGGFDDAFAPTTITVADPFAGDSDEEDEGAWGPFSDSNAAREATDSVSSSFTFSSTSSGDGFDDSFGDDFGDFQAAGGGATLDVPARIQDDDAGSGGDRTPTPGGSFHFGEDFGTDSTRTHRGGRLDDTSPPPTGGLHGAENGAPLERQPLPSRYFDAD